MCLRSTMLASAQVLRSLAVRGGVRVPLRFQCRAMVWPEQVLRALEVSSTPGSQPDVNDLCKRRLELLPRPASSWYHIRMCQTSWRSAVPIGKDIWQRRGRR